MKTPWTNRMKSERRRPDRDFYSTPSELAEAALRHGLVHYGIDHTETLDPGCGTGVWGRALRRVNPFAYLEIYGIDLNLQLPSDDFSSYQMGLEDDYLRDDVSLFTPKDFVMGNPPYSLAERFVRKSMEYLVDGGHIYFLLQLNFLGSRRRQVGLFREFPIKAVDVLTRRPSFFESNGKPRSTDASNYAMFLWQKGYAGPTTMSWLYWNYERTLAAEQP